MSIFSGSGVALVTPFQKDERVNYDKIDELLNYHYSHNTDAIIVCGTTGEATTLSRTEQIEVIRFVVEQVRGRLPVIAGTGSNCTASAIQMSKEAEKAGADGLLLVTPYYNKCTQGGLVCHYTLVAKECKLPIVLYNVESRTGVNMSPDTVAKLFSNVDNIVAIKEASGNMDQIVKIMNLTDGKMDVYSGNDTQIAPVLSMGGRGVISVLANILPEYVHTICEKFWNGDVVGSRRMQREVFPLIEKIFCEVNPIPIKKAMNLLGMEVGSLRMPLTEMADENKRELAEEMRAFGLSIGA